MEEEQKKTMKKEEGMKMHSIFYHAISNDDLYQEVPSVQTFGADTIRTVSLTSF